METGGARQHVYVYGSNLVKKFWNAGMFSVKEGADRPGCFIVFHTYDTQSHPEQVMTVSIAIGNDP